MATPRRTIKVPLGLAEAIDMFIAKVKASAEAARFLTILVGLTQSTDTVKDGCFQIDLDGRW